jgi:predicted glycosyltransferase
MKIWIDIKNLHEPLFFKSLMMDMQNHKFYITCRDYDKIVSLMNKLNIKHQVIGGRSQGSIIKRILGVGFRILELAFIVPKYNVALHHGSLYAPYASKLRFKKNIAIIDNDINHLAAKHMFKYVNYLLTPKVISKKILIKDNMKEEGIYQYDGFKEDIYIADFKPDQNFLQSLPFIEFVTIRAEALQATYVKKGATSIVPQIVKELSKKNINILFLPRYEYDKDYVKGFSNVFMPLEPLNGLDVCYYSKAMLTGSGTFAREAALLGTPAISFYPGNDLLAVDRELIRRGWMMHSRDPKEIVKYVMNAKNRKFDINRSKIVKNEVIKIIEEILNII